MNKRRFFLYDVKRVFEGYDTGQTYNAWDCPMFDFEQAQAVSEAVGGEYVAETDTFVFEGMYREYYPAYQHSDGNKYYPLGWKTWGWEVVVDEGD